MNPGDVTVVASDAYSSTLYVEREPTATTWSLFLDGAATSVASEPIPDPFIYKVEPLLPGEHTVEVQQSDDTPALVASGTLTWVSGDPSFQLPTVDDVAAIIRARTQDSHDDELGTFTDDTRPTKTEVERLIIQASTVVVGATGRLDDLQCYMADAIREQARYWISLMAAMLVELSYFPEQVRSDRSAFIYYKQLWDDDVFGFKGLIDAVAECKGGEVEPDVPGEGGAVVGDPSWAFPVDVGGMVGWQTQW